MELTYGEPAELVCPEFQRLAKTNTESQRGEAARHRIEIETIYPARGQRAGRSSGLRRSAFLVRLGLVYDARALYPPAARHFS